MKKRTYLVVAVLFLATSLTGCQVSPTARVSSLKLSAAELGTKEAIEPWLERASQDVLAINALINKAEEATANRNFGIAESHYSQANVVIHKWRDYIISFENNPRRVDLLYPDSMGDIRDKLRGVVRLRNLPAEGQLSGEQLNFILGRLRQLAEADKEFAAIVAARDSNPDLINAKAGVTIELSPLPFKVEILHGVLKVKKSFSLGNFRIDAGADFSGTRNGVTTLILVHQGQAAYYAVGNRQLAFDVPACHIDINGSVMTITTL